MIDVNDKFATLLKVALKGSDEALQQAYRHSLRMIAEYDLEFRWEWIDGYRVLTVLTDGAGINSDFSQIPGLSECI